MESMSERAVRWGIETQYLDAFGKRRSSDPDAIASMVDMLSQNDGRSSGILPQTLIVRDRPGRRVQIDLPPQHEIAWSVTSAQHAINGASAVPFLDLPNELSVGTYRLRATIKSSTGAENSEEATLLVAPERAYQGDEKGPRRVWALAVQLYGVRSHRNWGHGDFNDLARLIDLACDLGAAGVALNPLHAPFDDPAEASPYSPNSRLFLNPRYIDLEAVPEFPGVPAAGLQQQIEVLRQAEMIDYPGVVAAKRRALGLAYEVFLQRKDKNRQRAFERFRQERGSTLARFAAFEHLCSRFRKPWWEWPTEWRAPNDERLKLLRTAHEDSIAYYEYVQWIAHEQLTRCRDHAAQRGMPIGLYLDLAVGARPDGFDAWNSQDTLLRRAEIGAPPDVLNTAGQKWGLAGLNPIALERRAFEPFRDVLRVSMRYAGALRIDHVLGLQRLYLVPSGMAADKGVYVRLPFHALLAVIAQESVSNKCIVIGEDLGTVPENFREMLADWGIWSYQVMLFERDSDGSFHAPEHYRENALVTFATHDLPTLAGWLQRRDLEVKRHLAIDPGETDEERRSAHSALWNILSSRGMTALDFSSVVHYLAATPSRLLAVSMEDALGSAEQVNLPGTVGEHPNWRRRLPVDLENFKDQDGLVKVAEVLRAAGRSVQPM
jgi:4-alpha-glucanotransferase